MYSGPTHGDVWRLGVEGIEGVEGAEREGGERGWRESAVVNQTFVQVSSIERG